MIDIPVPLYCPVCRQECPGGPRPIPVWSCEVCGITIRLSAAQVEAAVERLAQEAMVLPDSAYLTDPELETAEPEPLPERVPGRRHIFPDPTPVRAAGNGR